ncbi:MAG: hypothetical protein R2710_19025 [Acidimicrobiales bacterium]
MANDPELFDKIVNLSKRRGVVYPSAEIYGGFAPPTTMGLSACCSCAT